MRVAILLPTKGRAAQMKARVNDLLMQSVPPNVDLTVVLAVCEDDEETIKAAGELIDQWEGSDVLVIRTYRPAGSTAVEGWNLAYSDVTDYADWLVLGADDIIWHPDWLANALKAAGDTYQVVGLHDGHTNLRHYGAHYMATAEFCAAHLGGVFIPPMYKSWWFDREVCEKAAGLGLYVAAWDALAEHAHPDWNKAPMDATYQEAWHLHDLDREVYEARKAAGFPVDYESVLVVEPVVEDEPIDATDAAIKLAAKYGIDLATVTGTGTDGRIIKSDVEAMLS